MDTLATEAPADVDALIGRQRREPARRLRQFWADWKVPLGLLALTLIPAIAGSVRLAELAGDTTVTPENERFMSTPVPVVLHIISATFYCGVGAFQFAPAFRRRYPRWHRMAGVALVPAGFVAALSGLWMTLFYDLPDMDGPVLGFVRLAVGVAMVGSLILGVITLKRRQFIEHGAWMMRAYAIGLAAGTQVLTHVPWLLLFGQPTEGPRAVLMTAGWLINAVVAERAIANRSATRRQRLATISGTGVL